MSSRESILATIEEALHTSGAIKVNGRTLQITNSTRRPEDGRLEHLWLGLNELIITDSDIELLTVRKTTGLDDPEDGYRKRSVRDISVIELETY